MGGGVPYLNTAQEFQAAQSNAGGKLLAVDFTASWCGPCKMIGPQFEAMQPQFPYVDFAKVDVDENKEVAMSCGIQAMPTFKFYRFGQQVAEFTGADANKLRALLLSHGGPPTTVDAGCDVALHCDGNFEDMVAISETCPRMRPDSMVRLDAARSPPADSQPIDRDAAKRRISAFVGR